MRCFHVFESLCVSFAQTHRHLNKKKICSWCSLWMIANFLDSITWYFWVIIYNSVSVGFDQRATHKMCFFSCAAWYISMTIWPNTDSSFHPHNGCVTEMTHVGPVADNKIPCMSCKRQAGWSGSFITLNKHIFLVTRGSESYMYNKR